MKNRNFDTEFNDVVLRRKEYKKNKKELFNKNVKPYLVIEDDEQSDKKIVKKKNTNYVYIISFAIFVIVLLLIIYFNC